MTTKLETLIVALATARNDGSGMYTKIVNSALLDEAIAALKEQADQQAQPQAEGMVLVPVEPTEEMIEVGSAEALRVSSFAQEIYEAMVGAYLASQKENNHG